MKYFLVVDDHEIVRSGVKNVLFELYKPCEVYEANDGKSAIQQLINHTYDLVLLDVQMPGTDTLGLMKYIHANFENTKVLIFSMSAEQVYARRFLLAGARGYISKDCGLKELTKAIDLILLNRLYISTDLAESLAKNSGDTELPLDKLSVREFEIADLLIKGNTITQITGLLSISASTIATHKARVFEKLGVKNIIELSEFFKDQKI